LNARNGGAIRGNALAARVARDCGSHRGVLVGKPVKGTIRRWWDSGNESAEHRVENGTTSRKRWIGTPPTDASRRPSPPTWSCDRTGKEARSSRRQEDYDRSLGASPKASDKPIAKLPKRGGPLANPAGRGAADQHDRRLRSHRACRAIPGIQRAGRAVRPRAECLVSQQQPPARWPCASLAVRPEPSA